MNLTIFEEHQNDMFKKKNLKIITKLINVL